MTPSQDRLARLLFLSAGTGTSKGIARNTNGIFRGRWAHRGDSASLLSVSRGLVG